MALNITSLILPFHDSAIHKSVIQIADLAVTDPGYISKFSEEISRFAT